uniref:G protein-coupled receptor n=1 Tax=Angiostrongylus cantonensis TaxID=6313 RepID=A0A0K0CYZ6_ANGCA
MNTTLFGNKRTYLVLLIPFIYCLYFIFYTPPILFNSDHMAWFFTTFAPHSNIENVCGKYYNYPHTVNNLLVVVVTTLIYVVYSKELLRNLQISNGLSWAQKSTAIFTVHCKNKTVNDCSFLGYLLQFFIQSSLICFANLVASVIYVYMQFFYAPPSFVLVGHMGWQLGHGFPAFVYLLLNKTIQREVLQMLGIRKRQHAVAPRTRNTSKTPGTEG